MIATPTFSINMVTRRLDDLLSQTSVSDVSFDLKLQCECKQILEIGIRGNRITKGWVC